MLHWVFEFSLLSSQNQLNRNSCGFEQHHPTLDGRNPKQPPEMYKTWKNNGINSDKRINYIPINWWVYLISPINSIFKYLHCQKQRAWKQLSGVHIAVHILFQATKNNVFLRCKWELFNVMKQKTPLKTNIYPLKIDAWKLQFPSKTWSIYQRTCIKLLAARKMEVFHPFKWPCK